MQELGGSTARQRARLASGNVPYHGHLALFVNGGWLGEQESFFFFPAFHFSMSSNPLLSGNSTFPGVHFFLGVL